MLENFRHNISNLFFEFEFWEFVIHSNILCNYLISDKNMNNWYGILTNTFVFLSICCTLSAECCMGYVYTPGQIWWILHPVRYDCTPWQIKLILQPPILGSTLHSLTQARNMLLVYCSSDRGGYWHISPTITHNTATPNKCRN